jgi:hypothetical protein
MFQFQCNLEAFGKEALDGYHCDELKKFECCIIMIWVALLAKCMVKYIETDPILHTLGIHNQFVTTSNS